MDGREAVAGLGPMASGELLVGRERVDPRPDGFVTGGLDVGDGATPTDFLDDL